MKSELIHENTIIIDKFTYKSSDYYKNDIVNNYIKLNNIRNPNTKIKIKKIKKKELFEKLCECINNLKNYELKIVIKLQSYIRRYLVNIKMRLRGPGVYKKSNNTDDFYFSTSKSEIGYTYYYSYRDYNNNIWMFDVRSVYKLVTDSTKPLNPYTRIEIPHNEIIKIKKIIKYLQKNKIQTLLDYETTEIDIDTKINNIVIKISNDGYNIERSWIDNLSLGRLKKLYISFQDMWYYRIELTPNVRNSIVNEQLFRMSHMRINLIADIDELKYLLFTDIYKLINTSNTHYSSTASLWCILSFGTIIKKCIYYNQWINMII